MPASPLLQFGPYRLDGADGQLCRHGQVVHLPPKALAVLWQLANQAGRVVPKDTLLDTVWADTVVSDGVLTACIRDLRQALGDDARRARYIETVHRRGYRFVAAVERLATPLPSVSAMVVPKLSPAQQPAGMVGRDAEVAQVHTVFERARGGQRQVLFVSGEAGIGKTTLVEACMANLDLQEAGWVGWGQCVEAYGPGTGYLPILEALGRLCRGPHGATVIDHLLQWAPTWLVQLAGVLPPAEHELLQRHTRGATRERRMRELAEVLEALTVTQPLVLVLEDLHWSDASTVDVLAMLARRREVACLLVLGTYRPVELILRSHPLRQAVSELQLHGQCAELALHYLSPQAVQAYVAHRFPGHLAAPIGPVLYQRTAGHPLFMVHLAEYLAQQVGLDRGTGEEIETRVVAVVDTVPAGVQQLIELQLARLREDEQCVLKMASVAGVEFAAASVAAGMQLPVEKIEAICQGLLQRGPFVEASGLAAWSDGTLSGQYRFQHALYQQVLYRRLTEMQRVQGHRRIGERLEAGYGARAGEMAAELAMHFECGQDTTRAITYHIQAGQRAAEHSAHVEAATHFHKGLELLKTLPDTPARTQQELDVWVVLGPTLMATKGLAAPEVEHAYTQALALCRQHGEPPQLFPVLSGRWRLYLGRGMIMTARALGEQLLTLARRQNDPSQLLTTHQALGIALYFLGEFLPARLHLEQGLTFSNPAQQRVLAIRNAVSPEVHSLCYLSAALWTLGYPEQALHRVIEACTLARALNHPHSLVVALYWRAVLHQYRGEAEAAYEQADVSMQLAAEYDFVQFKAQSIFLCGWALAVRGQSEVGLAQMRQGMQGQMATGTKNAFPYYLALLIAAHGIPQVAEGQRLLAEALVAVDAGRLFYYAAELYRLKGELFLQQSDPDTPQAEVCFHQALEVARRQHAKSWGLRTAMSLSRVWQQQGKRADAYRLLTEIYGWFTEGFDTMDLQEAQALLAELS